MAYVWVQQWVALPLIVEEPMGDSHDDSTHQLSNLPDGSTSRDARQQSVKLASGSTISPVLTDQAGAGNVAPFQSQFGSTHPYPQSDGFRHMHQPAAVPYTVASDPNVPSLNMGAMAGALPDYTASQTGARLPQHPQSGHRGISGASTSAVVYQLQQNMQFPSQAGGLYGGHAQGPAGYAQPFPAHYQASQAAQHGGYQPAPMPQHRSGGPSPVQQSYPTFQQHPSPYFYYHPPYGMMGQTPQAFAPPLGQPMPMNRRSSFPTSQHPMAYHGPDGGVLGSSLPSTGRSVGVSGVLGEVDAVATGQGSGRHGSESNAGSLPRGPPRKPRQSGHALWVGNLPPGTTVIDLKDHFSKDATKDIESLFLISKSNCAFVNYRTEASCTAAMHRFHDSRFHGVRLVCRLRRSSAPASGVPTGPSAMSAPRDTTVSPQKSSPIPPLDEPTEEDHDGVAETVDRPAGDGASPTSNAAEKFFIVKSLTVQDLELSLRNGIWATQAHNEETLNKAYESTDNVYLIFSANKSGEYFGYARMASPIGQDTAETVGTVSKPEAVEPADAPKSIPTPATEHAPKGRIIDDSARGTIFWEAQLSDAEEEETKVEEEDREPDNAKAAQGWGKAFRIEWISTNRLPFYRTRGLRNPWNANREVKIARDGTELETSVGKRLVQMFHRLGPSSAGPSALPPMPLAMTSSVPPMRGPHMRLY